MKQTFKIRTEYAATIHMLTREYDANLIRLKADFQNGRCTWDDYTFARRLSWFAYDNNFRAITRRFNA